MNRHRQLVTGFVQLVKRRDLFVEGRGILWCLRGEAALVQIPPKRVVLCHNAFGPEGAPANGEADDIAQFPALALLVGAEAFRPFGLGLGKPVRCIGEDGCHEKSRGQCRDANWPK